MTAFSVATRSPRLCGVVFRIKGQHVVQRAAEVRGRVCERLTEGGTELRLKHDFLACKNGIVLAPGVAYGFFRGKTAAFQHDGAFIQMMKPDNPFEFLFETTIEFWAVMRPPDRERC